MEYSLHAGRLQGLAEGIDQLLQGISNTKDGDLIAEVFASVVEMTGVECDRLDWKILRATLQDLERGFQMFHPYRHIRKVSIFGSSRLPAESPECQLARKFAHYVTLQGFMVMTGAGGGIMAAGNQGAGAEQSFGLNIQLPFEQGANPFISGDPKLADFKYFFTRKLFFLRETDAIALFPGGFGTQDEAFECLTLCQTGKSPPIPLVLIDRPGGSYWLDWDAYIKKHLVDRQMINPEDRQLYTITDDLATAYESIAQFYRVYHSSRFVGDQLVIRLNHALSDAQLTQLNQQFPDILVSGTIQATTAFPEEADPTQPHHIQSGIEHLPRLALTFNQRDYGRLYQMISVINQMGQNLDVGYHPQRK